MTTPDTTSLREAERLRTGLRVLIRDWSEGWEDCTPFDQRDAYRAAAELLGADFDNDPTWLAAHPAPPGADAGAGERVCPDRWKSGHRCYDHATPAEPDAGDVKALDAILVALWQCETERGFEHMSARVHALLATLLRTARAEGERHVVHVTAEPIAEDVVWCEECLIEALNAGGIPTVASCCGHNGKGSDGEGDGRPGWIMLDDGRTLTIARAGAAPTPTTGGGEES